MDENNNTSAAEEQREPTQGQAEKTFTQAEVNELISREKARVDNFSILRRTAAAFFLD